MDKNKDLVVTEVTKQGENVEQQSHINIQTEDYHSSTNVSPIKKDNFRRSKNKSELRKLTLCAFESNENFNREDNKDTKDQLDDESGIASYTSYYSPNQENLKVKGRKFKTRP